jgi:hypothetical protein
MYYGERRCKRPKHSLGSRRGPEWCYERELGIGLRGQGQYVPSYATTGILSYVKALALGARRLSWRMRLGYDRAKLSLVCAHALARHQLLRMACLLVPGACGAWVARGVGRAAVVSYVGLHQGCHEAARSDSCDAQLRLTPPLMHICMSLVSEIGVRPFGDFVVTITYRNRRHASFR